MLLTSAYMYILAVGFSAKLHAPGSVAHASQQGDVNLYSPTVKNAH